jgi:TolA-binding protein
MQQADEQGALNVSVECQIYMAEAMIQSNDIAHAQPELARALLRADKIGLKALSAKAHYLLGNALRASGNQVEAQHNYRTTVQLLDEMRKEPGAEKILQRLDFKNMYDEATRGSHSEKS